jgi:CRISPR system Cascade subunit CasE
MTATLTAPRNQTTSMPILAAVPFDHPALARRVRDWNDAEQIHKAVMSLFREDLPGPQHQRRATAEILYRVEHHAARILLQSATAPAHSDYGIRTTHLSGLATHLTAGTAVRFRLDINAVRCQAGTHRRTPVPDADLPQWAAARLHPALTAVTLLDQPVTVRRTDNSPLRVAHLTGTARINDPDALLGLIRSGVGRAKAYGCGLLSVVPMSE